MKKKSFNKRLNLNKSTIATLGPRDLESIRGGLVTEVTGITCGYCDSDLSCNNAAYNCMWDKSCLATCITIAL